MKRLIINADDYGLTPGCDWAITTATKAGAVSSVSCIVQPGQQLLPVTIQRRSGVHLRLTDGRPLAPACRVPSLVNESGYFPVRAVQLNRLNPEEVLIEWREQVRQFTCWNAEPTHLDSHHHVHGLVPLRNVYADVCADVGAAGVPLSDQQRRQLRSRGVDCADVAEVRWTDGMLDTLQRLLTADFADFDSVHLMTHPGQNDGTLQSLSAMTATRESEYKVLMGPALRRWLRENDIETLGYADLF
jgi:predicted glycoside hydrolase/deacetylase ChbG (UPF0249 family)